MSALQIRWKLALLITVPLMIFLFFYYWVFYDFFKGSNPLGFNGEWGRRIQEGEKQKVYQEIFRFVVILGPLLYGAVYFVLEYGPRNSHRSHTP